ncbi:MAG: hypothetical protein V3R84_02580 [Acidimicrobiia bacterium]
MHRSRIMLVAAAAIGTISLALPFVRFDQQGSIAGIDGYAWPVVVVLAVPAALAVFGDRAEALRTSLAVPAIGFAGVAIVLAAFKFADAVKAADTPGAGLGAGPWILLGASVLGMAGALASLTRRI